MVQNIDVLIKTFADLKGVNEAKKSFTDLRKVGNQVVRVTGDIDKNGKKMAKSFSVATTNIKQFKMEFLGLLFFGFVIQRFFQNLARTAQQSLMKISQGTLDSAKAFNILSANMELLKFSIGDALGKLLMDLLPTLIPVLTAISDWVQQNPKLAAGLLTVGIIGGGLMSIVGQLVLGLSSLSIVLGGAGGGLIATLGAVAAPILAIAGAALFAIAVWQDWFGIRTMFEDFGKSFGEMVKGPLLRGVAWFVDGLNAIKSALEAVWQWGFSVGQVFGNFVKGVWLNLIRIWVDALTVLQNIVKAIQDAIAAASGFVGSIAQGIGIPSFQTGGVMPHTGLALVHKGERITPPSGETNFNGGINITVNGGGNLDPQVLASIISEQLGLEIRARTSIGANKFLT